MASGRSGQYGGAGLEVLVGQLKDAVAFVDPTGRVLLSNREQGLVVPGASELADLGDPFQIFRPDGRPYKPAEWPVLRSVTSGEVVVDEEFFRLAPDGERRSFSCRSAPIYSNGSIVAAVVVTRDVADSVLTQAALGETNSRTEAIPVAKMLATAVESSEEDKRLDSAREAERSRIARDLHDEALRELTDAFALATIGRSTTPQPDDERRWAGLITALQRVDQQLRSAIYDLRLGAHEERPFADLLGDLVTIQANIDIDRNVQLYGREALPAGSLGHHGVELLRILREAMINARRHSGATTIRVDAGGSSEDVLRLEVTDDGGWPDLASAVRSLDGTGIKGMLERADLLGADLQIESRRGGGTRVSVELSLAALGRAQGNGERVGYTRTPK